jgi:hypothetical protein
MAMSRSEPMYILYVDDNYHHGDESERYKAGEFSSLEDALAAARKIVDSFLKDAYKDGTTADELYRQYTMFGEDPFIAGGPPESTFSAWDYAKERCEKLCGE